MRTFWSDSEKFPKPASEEILEGLGQHFGLGTFLEREMCLENMVLRRNEFVVEFEGIHPAQMNSMVFRSHMGRLLCHQTP